MKSNKLYDFKEQKKAVIEWVQEQKEKHKDQKNFKEPQTTINIEQLNFIKNNTSIDVQISNQSTILLQQLNFQQFNEFVNIYQETGEKNKETVENEIEYDDQSNIKEHNITRIPLSLKYPEVLDYFMQLTKHKNNGHIKKKDIENLVKANFEFRDMKASGKKKLLDVNIEKQILNQFIYTFYDGHDYSNYTNKAKMYCQFMIDNFLPFQFDNITTLRKNFSRKSSAHYPFSK
jgi:multidrug efflux pump subunit AcrB